MKINLNILFCLTIFFSGAIYSTLQAQQKGGIDSGNFSGEWLSNESISMGGNIVCSFDEGDHMLSKTLKIEEQTDFLIIKVPNPSPSAPMAMSQEKLDFNGIESQINHGNGRGKKYNAKLSTDRRTMTIQSTVSLIMPSPYHASIKKQEFVYITEVWKLSQNGQSISVQTRAKSNIYEEERFWTTTFDKVN